MVSILRIVKVKIYWRGAKVGMTGLQRSLSTTSDHDFRLKRGIHVAISTRAGLCKQALYLLGYKLPTQLLLIENTD